MFILGCVCVCVCMDKERELGTGDTLSQITSIQALPAAPSVIEGADSPPWQRHQERRGSPPIPCSSLDEHEIFWKFPGHSMRPFRLEPGVVQSFCRKGAGMNPGSELLASSSPALRMWGFPPTLQAIEALLNPAHSSGVWPDYLSS